MRSLFFIPALAQATSYADSSESVANYQTGGNTGTDASGKNFGSSTATGSYASADDLAAPAVRSAAGYTDSGTLQPNALDSMGSDNLTQTMTDGQTCAAHGFLCDFSQASKLGVYTPEQFRWKVIDPATWNNKEEEMTTLNCEMSVKGTGTSAHFYVKTGSNNYMNSDYCDLSAVKRTVYDSTQEMMDMIKVRGETARLSDNEDATQSLLGEHWDLTCVCKTDLSEDASVASVNTGTSFLTTMNGTEQSRKMCVKLKLYQDELLAAEASGAYPDDKQYYWFVTHHCEANDWDVQLQITTCVACATTAVTCASANSSADEILFWEKCKPLYGGPQTIDTNTGSWMDDASPAAVSGISCEGSEGNSANASAQCSARADWGCSGGTCRTETPWDDLNIQKFKLTGVSAMKVTCMIEACESRPCNSCKPRRALSPVTSRRSLEEQGSVDVSLMMFFNPNSNTNEMGQDGQMKDSSSKKGVNAVLLGVVLVLLAGSALAIKSVFDQRKNNTVKQTARDDSVTATSA